MVTAEAANRQQIEIDQQFYELVSGLGNIASQPTPARLPQAERYGRSLGTIYRLGTYAVGKTAPEIISSPEAQQAKAEFYTSVEEGFGTDVELGGGLEVRDFDTRPVMAGRVMAKDRKTAVSDMTEAGLICAEETAKTDRHFLPQLMRSRWDHHNALQVDKMAKGETDYNTRIVISPFPEEAAAQSGNDYWRNIGYVPHLKRGFVQLYHANGESLLSGSLSFDGSNKERLREVFRKRGMEIPETELTDSWLQHALTATLSPAEAKALALEIADEAGDSAYKKTTNTVHVTHEFKAVMDTVFNESYVHACESLARGSQTPALRQLIMQLSNQAGHFNRRYAKSLYEMRANQHQFTDDNMVALHELLVYSTIEIMRGLHLKKTQPKPAGAGVNTSLEFTAAYLQSLSTESFQSILSGFGAEGARNNRTYSACGLSISLGSGDVLTGQADFAPQDIFGGVDAFKSLFGSEKDSNCTYISKECPLCHAKNVKTVSKAIVEGGKRLTHVTGSCGCSKKYPKKS